MRNVDVLKIYNLVNDKGNKLRLMLGMLKSRKDDICIPNADKGYRWSFVGPNIPMPVRSATWFNGFPEEVMLDWLKGNGWYVHTCVNIQDGRAKVYELPKGNELTIKDAVCKIAKNGNMLDAIRLYSYIHECDWDEADKAIREFIDKQP